MNDSATLWWDTPTGCIRYVEQTLLPGEYRIVECRTVERLAEAIRRLEIRGAPALGVAGGYGVALAAATAKDGTYKRFMEEVERAAGVLRATRPTAINLGWGIDRVLSAVSRASDTVSAKEIALAEAEAIAREDTACCHAIGEHGARLLPDSCTVLTHCNAGALACSSWGTALGVIRSAVNAGKDVKVIACETRPLLQGARLTAWELVRDGIDVTVITDSTAAYLMRVGAIDAVIVGADRITRDAVFNKIGTYMHAVCAKYHGIPFYVAAPSSTFDPENIARDVTIEQRGREELSVMGNRTFIPPGAQVKNYAFDATPMELVSAVITERGVLYPPIDPGSVAAPKQRP
ncbi:MAG: S-methyl-5-thioribose-1-phosphate isomerase [Methanoregula sp.]|jgi:methylthioribose-1-phosphate isomerase|uniref:S-methyl-5-thioribose-1-phosphate isomerase n=1 Tax=Methanoregula sp. TaxID=2052170 RepID=UPI003D0C344C